MRQSSLAIHSLAARALLAAACGVLSSASGQSSDRTSTVSSVASPPATHVRGSRPALDLGVRRLTYGMDAWREAEGLPQATVRAILQTRDGYLWLGTRSGVVRFDGATFAPFSVASGSLLDDEVTALAQDGGGVLWIGTYRGLTAYSRGRFTSYSTREGLSDDSIRALDVDASGALWIGTAKGVCRRSGAGFRCYTRADGLSSDSIRALCARASEGVFVAAGTALNRLSGDRFVDASSILSHEDGRIRVLSPGIDGSLLIGFEKAVVKRFGQGRVTTYAAERGVGAMVNGILEDGEGNLWLCDMGGLRRLRGGRAAPILMDAADGRLGPTWCLHPDREGNLWVGTLSEGLVRLRKNLIVTLTEADGLANDVVQCVFEDQRGTLWVGTTKGIVSFEEGRPALQRQRSGQPITMVFSAAEDREGRLWIAAGRELLVRRNGVFEPSPHWKPVDVDIRALLRDSRDRLWIGTDGAGLYRIDGRRVTAIHRSDGLGAEAVRCIHESRDGALWVGTFGGGVSKLVDGRFTTYTSAQGLANDLVYAIAEDDDGALYFSTRGGLSRLKDGRFTTFRERDGLLANFSFNILDDGHGTFWFSSARGLFSVAKADLRAFADGRTSHLSCAVYGVRQGLRTASCVAGHQPTAIKTRDGWLAFCTMKGLAVVEPERLSANRLAPPVRIEAALFDGQPVDLDHFGVLQPGVREVEIHYTALSFVAPEKVRFRYQLEGFDRGWIDPDGRRLAHYAGLPPGEYRFRVIGCNDNGVWNDTGASFAFRLKPRFRQTAWFYGICVLAAIAGAAIVVRLRIRRLEAREEELRKRVDEALAKVKVLRGLLPICASCKKIRDDKGYWRQIEKYIHERSEADFSHGICPECMARLYPDVKSRVTKASEEQ